MSIHYINEWSTIDKTPWGPGQWQDEPDKVHWIDEATDLDCLMVRHETSGHWCGYVAVTEGHPAFKKDYDDVDVEVHGGLTFASLCQETGNPGTGVCHVPQAGRPDEVWWLGFDCHHAWDLSPRWSVDPHLAQFEKQSVYRDRAYVEREVVSLANQLWHIHHD